MGGWNGDPTALSPQYIIMTNPRGFCPLWAVPRQSGRAVLNELLLSVLARRSPPSPAQLPDRPQPRRPSTSARAAAGPHFGRNRQWRRHRQRRPAEVRGPAPAYAPRQVPGEACCAGAAIFLPEQTSLAKDDVNKVFTAHINLTKLCADAYHSPHRCVEVGRTHPEGYWVMMYQILGRFTHPVSCFTDPGD